MALYRICKNESAEAVAHSIGRDPRSVRAWLKKYNKFGPEALHYSLTIKPLLYKKQQNGSISS
uniref:helix-turn-helix domain-containing protein n=1 Tax=Endozoicomonas sp. Mp262 TaxID=2919499 RepID=UPI00351B6F52